MGLGNDFCFGRFPDGKQRLIKIRGLKHMKKLLLYASLSISLALCTSVTAHAQLGGCEDSPENPTLILAGLATGAFAVSSVRTRIRARRKAKEQ